MGWLFKGFYLIVAVNCTAGEVGSGRSNHSKQNEVELSEG